MFLIAATMAVSGFLTQHEIAAIFFSLAALTTAICIVPGAGWLKLDANGFEVRTLFVPKLIVGAT